MRVYALHARSFNDDHYNNNEHFIIVLYFKHKKRTTNPALASDEKASHWSQAEKKALVTFFVEKNISHWPSHRHKSGTKDTWSDCADFIAARCSTTLRSGNLTQSLLI